MPENKKEKDQNIIKEELKNEGRTAEETSAPIGEQEVMLHPDEILVQWRAKEFVQYQRHVSWYAAGAVIAIVLFLIAVFTLNFLFALIIILFTAVTYIYAKKVPQYLTVIIAKRGVKINKRFFAYGDDISKFWILYRPPDLKTLHLERKPAFVPNLVIELEDQDPIKVREILLKYLPEDTTQEEKAMDKISRQIGF